MLALPSGIKVYIARDPVRMNKSFSGLAALVESDFKRASTDGDLFVFFNKRADKVKVLYWDRNGYAIWYKHLSEGRYRLPSMQSKHYSVSISELNCLLEGIDLTNRRRLRPL